MAGTFGDPEIVEKETDILIVGGGMAACGAAYEAVRTGQIPSMKIGRRIIIPRLRLMNIVSDPGYRGSDSG